MEKVYFYFEKEYTEKKMDAFAEKLFAPYGGVRGLTAGKKNVLVKPNLVSKKPLDSGATTHPAMLRAVCKQLLNAGINVCVAESHGGFYSEATIKSQFAGCGITKALSGLDVQLCTNAETVVLQYKSGDKTKSFEVIKPVADTDLIINMCKVKTHSLTVFSGAAKNTFGVIPGLRKFELHAKYTDINDFVNMLNDLHLLLPVELNIADGIIGMEGNGPTSGIPRRYGFVAVSKNAFMCDLICADILGLSAYQVPQIKDAVKRSLCPDKASYEYTNLSKEVYESIKVKDLILPDSSPSGAVSCISMLQNIGGGKVIRLFQPKPEVNLKQCVGCGKCAEYCPVHTIEMKNKRPKINRDKCIRCFCCQELCPIGAMHIKTNRILKL